MTHVETYRIFDDHPTYGLILGRAQARGFTEVTEFSGEHRREIKYWSNGRYNHCAFRTEHDLLTDRFVHEILAGLKYCEAEKIEPGPDVSPAQNA